MLTWSSRFGHESDFLFKAAYLLACFAQALTGQIGVHVNFDLRQCRLHLFQFAPGLGASLVENLHALLFQLMPLLLKLLALVLKLGPLHAQVKAFVLRCLAIGLQSFQQVLHAYARAAQELTSTLNNALVKSQAISDCQRIATSRQADAQPIG